MEEDDKQAAEGYRRQRQATSAKIIGYKPLTLEEQLKWTVENREIFLKLIRGAGPPRQDEEKILEHYRQMLLSTSAGSEFDDVNGRAIVERVIREVEEVCSEHGLPTHAGVVYGTNAMVGLDIGQRAVLKTEASIIEVSIHFLSFVNGITRLLARTIPYQQVDDDQIRVWRNIEAVHNVLREDIDLAHDWSETLTSFATVGVQPQGSRFQLTEGQNAIRTTFLRAIETFAIGHEYGHHSMGHGRATSSANSATDAFQEEFAADIFGRGCSMAIGAREDEDNFYTVSGAGAVLILGSEELLRRITAVLKTGCDATEPSSTHPPYMARVENLAFLDARLHEDNRQDAVDYRQFAVEVIEALWRVVKPIVLDYHRSGIRPKQDSTETAGWLPS